MLRTIDMRTFVVLTRLRNFRRTAEELHTTQPAISGRLAALERHFDQRLIERGDGLFRLTAAGEQVLRGFEAALRELDQLNTELSGSPAPRAEPLRIGAIDTVAATWMPQLIDRLHARFIDLQIDLTVDGTANLLGQLHAGRLDLVLAIQPLIEEGIRSFSPCTFEMTWAGSPSLIDPARKYTPQELAKMPIISFPRDTPPFLMVAPYFQDERVLASKLTFCNSLYAIVSLLLDGFGVAALPTVTIQREVRRREISQLEVTKRFPAMPIVASYRPDARREFTHAVIESVRAAAEEFCERGEPGVAWVT